MKKICEWCGAEFENHHGKQKFCNRACYIAAYRKHGPERTVQAKRGERPMTPNLEHFFTAIAKYLVDKGVEFKDF